MSIFIHYRYVLTVAKARGVGVVWKGLGTEKILTRLDLAEYMEANGQVMFVSLFARRLQLNQSILTQTKKQTKETTRWVPLRDTTRLQSMEIRNSQDQVVLEKNPCGNVRGRQRL